MHPKTDKPKENKSRAVANTVSRNINDNECSLGFVDNRKPSTISLNTLSPTLQNSSDILQRVSVLQLATRQSSPVRFNGTAYQLEQLIRRWGPPSGTQVVVTQTDFVGGMFRVRFTNNNGPAISLETADGWVDAGISHADEDSDSESSDNSSESDG